MFFTPFNYLNCLAQSIRCPIVNYKLMIVYSLFLFYFVVILMNIDVGHPPSLRFRVITDSFFIVQMT